MQNRGCGSPYSEKAVSNLNLVLEKKIKDYENGDKSITAAAYKTYVAELKNVKTALGEDKQ